MQVEFTGRQIEIPVKLRNMATERLEEIERLIGIESTAHIVLTEQKFLKIAEVSIQCKTCTDLAARCEDKDMERALHDALMKVEKQVLRTVKRSVTKRRHPEQTANGSVRLQTADTKLSEQPGVVAARRRGMEQATAPRYATAS